MVLTAAVHVPALWWLSYSQKQVCQYGAHTLLCTINEHKTRSDLPGVRLYVWHQHVCESNCHQHDLVLLDTMDKSTFLANMVPVHWIAWLVGKRYFAYHYYHVNLWGLYAVVSDKVCSELSTHVNSVWYAITDKHSVQAQSFNSFVLRSLCKWSKECILDRLS